MMESGGQPLRVAVIGAGPSGIYAAMAVLKKDPAATVDVFDRVPAPFGLVRYGVAPDHPKMKSVVKVLARPFESGRARFFGNVEVGRDVTLEQLRSFYHAIIHATGCTVDRELGIPGSDLDGSLGSADVVGWYSAHIDRHQTAPRLDSSGIAVIGGGNVALDVARVLARQAEELVPTDVPDAVIDELSGSQVTDIHVIVRRGPAEAQFTPAELVQLGHLPDVDIIVHDDGVLDDAGSADTMTKHQLENLRTLQEWASRPPSGRTRRIHLRFLRSPREILGDTRVRGLVLERNRLVGSGAVAETAEYETLDVGLVVRAIGYRSIAIPGLPFDERSGTVPNDAGRVVDDDVRVPGTYVAGWLKRGPSGVIGTNMADANETVSALFDDRNDLPEPDRPTLGDVVDFLTDTGIEFVDWPSWARLDTAEIELGGRRGAERVKVAGREAMLGFALAGTGESLATRGG